MAIKIFFIYFIILTFIEHCDTIFDVVRTASGNKNGVEPYVPVNYFANKNNLCFFSYCWNREGKCQGSFSCCDCQCKESKTFLSMSTSCYNGKQIKDAMADVLGQKCEFATRSMGFKYVPLFSESKNLKDIEIYSDDLFMKNNDQISCKAGAVNVYDYHGHELLYRWNECSEIIRLSSQNGKLFLQWTSNVESDWTSLKGQLLSVKIDCKKTAKEETAEISAELYSSCFLFQIEGKYMQGDHWEVPTKQPNCPVTSPPTTHTTNATESTHTTIDDQTTATYTKLTKLTTTTTTKPLTNTAPTTTRNDTAILREKDTTGGGSGVITAAVCGILVLLVVIIAVILVVVVRRKKSKKMRSQPSAAVNLIREPARPNRYEDYGAHYAVPDVGIKTGEHDDAGYMKPLDKEGVQYVAIDDEDEKKELCGGGHYASIPDENEYENPSVHIPRTNSDMSKRPLPQMPRDSAKQQLLENENPYYEASDVCKNQQEGKSSDENNLYNIYSSLSELRDG